MWEGVDKHRNRFSHSYRTFRYCQNLMYSPSEAPAICLNLLTPNVNYSGRTAPLTSKVAFYIFIQQI